ncbi:exosporium glycoprotein BclB-related protein, partial [Bacillus pseudomycoides]|uniref:exosporium glycoprotein BclB-related protein n=1 Tax=Bacillus pseudomycoides TaxID=64104 RepID=UPI002FFE02AF
PTGPTGPASIIPFASGGPAELVTLAGGLLGTGSLIGFGSFVPNVSILGADPNTTLTLPLTGIANEAFVVPRNGTIESIYAHLSAITILNLGTDATVRAQVYINTNPANNNFTAISSTLVTLNPNITVPIVGFQNLFNSVTGLTASVNAGDRLVMVFTVTANGSILATTVTGYASAGITIAY